MNIQYDIKTYISAYGGKLFWALAPLIFGVISWLLVYGPGRLIQAVPILYAMSWLVCILILIIVCYKTCEYSSTHNQVLFFEYPLRLPNWKILAKLISALIILYILYSLILYILYSEFFTWEFWPMFNSIVFGVSAFPFLEELFARSFFIKYRMSGIEFIIFNLISSAAFTIMHAGISSSTMYELFFINGHFPFSFLLGIITYKTQRIEPAILIHMASNFFVGSQPGLISYSPIIGLFFTCIQILFLGALHHRKK